MDANRGMKFPVIRERDIQDNVCLCLAIPTSWHGQLGCSKLDYRNTYYTRVVHLSTTMDFIMTIDSDDEKRIRNHNGKLKNEEEFRIDLDFHFDLPEDPYVELLQSDQLEDIVKKISKPVNILFDACFKFALLNHP